MNATTKAPKTQSLGSVKNSAPLAGAKPGYKHTKLGWIPEDWEVSRYGEMTTLLTNGFVGTATTHYTESGDGVPYIQGYNVLEFGIDYHGMCKVTRAFHEKNSKSCLQTGDLLTIQTGDIGVTAAVPDNLAGANCHALVISRFLEGEAFAGYYLQYLNSPTGRAMIRRIETGSTMKHINVGDLKREWVVKPTVEEQRRIAAVLGAWDRAIATTQQLVAAQQQRKQGLMQELLTGKRRFPGFAPKGGTRYVKSRIGLVPSDWKETPMRKLFTERDECGFNDLPLLSVTSTGVVLQSDTERKDNSKEDKSAYKRICPGDIGYNTMRMWQGRSAVSHIEGIVSPAYTIITPTKLMDVGYAGHLFHYQPMVHLFYRYSQGMASDTWNLKYKHFGPIIIPVPSMEEQRAIATLLTSIDSYVTELQTTLDHLTTQKRGLMQQLLTGAVRVKK